MGSYSHDRMRLVYVELAGMLQLSLHLVNGAVLQRSRLQRLSRAALCSCDLYLHSPLHSSWCTSFGRPAGVILNIP